jgi:hypothetical protein
VRKRDELEWVLEVIIQRFIHRRVAEVAEVTQRKPPRKLGVLCGSAVNQFWKGGFSGTPAMIERNSL